jgi:hypothetical protein
MLLVREWTSLSIFVETKGKFLEFANGFLLNKYIFLMEQEPPRMLVTYQEKLHLNPDIKVGDWFLFKRYIVIRIYGYGVEPCQLHVYIPPLLFALEYYGKRLATNKLHFISKSKKPSFNLRATFSSFIIKNRPTIDYVNNLLSSFGLKKDVLWKYDPYHVIS